MKDYPDLPLEIRDGFSEMESNYKCKIRALLILRIDRTLIICLKAFPFLAIVLFSPCVFEGTRSSAHQQTSSWSWNMYLAENYLITSVSMDA